MKKKLLYLILVIITVTFSFHASAQLSGYLQEDFEGTFPPSGWQTVNVLDAANVWEQSSSNPYSGFSSAYINYTIDTSVQGEDWLILPQFTVSASDSFSFWMAVAFIDYPPDSTWILVSTTDDNLSSFTSVVATLSEGDNYPIVANMYQYYSYSLSDFAGEDIYVALKNRNKYGDGLYFDLVTIGTAPGLNATAASIDLPDFVSTVTSIVPKATIEGKVRFEIFFDPLRGDDLIQSSF